VGGENSAQAWYTQLVTSVGGADGSNPKESLLGKLNAA
jgi:hypothetical protein